jgi:hypothetical protein
MAETRALYEFIIAANFASFDDAAEWHRTGPLGPTHAVERTGCEHGASLYDEELTRLRSFMAQLNRRRQSVFAALAASGAS